MANTRPIFNIIPANAFGIQIITANTARDGSGTLYTAGTAGTSGGLLQGVRFWASQASVGVVASKVLTAWVTASNGTTILYKVGEVLLTGLTTTNILICPTALITPDKPIPMLAGQLVRVQASICASAADYVYALPYFGDY